MLSADSSRADAEDALQEVFLAVYRALPGFRGESRLSTWVYRIAIRVAFRLKARRSRSRSREEQLDSSVATPLTEDPVAHHARSQRLTSALSRVSAEHRTVITLFALEGMTHKEIAEVLNVPEGTVWSRLHIARKRLAAELANLEHP